MVSIAKTRVEITLEIAVVNDLTVYFTEWSTTRSPISPCCVHSIVGIQSPLNTTLHSSHTYASSDISLIFVTGSGKSGLKSPMIKHQKLAEMPFRWKIFNFRFLAYIIK